MDDLEHGWLVGNYFNGNNKDEDVKCYCEWCERPIYYNSAYYVIDGDRICYKCKDKYENKIMEEEMYEND